MSINDLFHRDNQGFQQNEPLSDDAVEGFLRTLENLRKEDMPCSEVYRQLDEYVEKIIHGEDAERLMPLLREHLDICADCCDEYEALLNVLRANLNKK